MASRIDTSGFEKGTELTKEIFETMNAKESWVLVRRITITYEDGVQSKLHQMIVQTQPMRVDLLQRIQAAMKASK